ncbi:hypothetical protein ACFPK9_09315 [Rubritalea spongiae]|uniref:Uncharacterized protein n=1 Tax=Rubritalea spongiae TaxID=430797 RepID=A0ABW5E3I3_9BACT
MGTLFGHKKGSFTGATSERKLFAVSREKRKSTNDSDRLRKYLSKFDLSFDDIN